MSMYSHEILPICHSKYPHCFCSGYPHVIYSSPCIAACSQSSMLANPLSHSLDTHSLCHLWDVRLCALSSTFLSSGRFCLSSFLIHFKNGLDYFSKWAVQVFIVLIFLLQSLGSKSFLVRLRYSFLFFFHLCLYDGVPLQSSLVLVIFFFTKRSDSFLVWLFYSFGIFFVINFNSYILVLYIVYVRVSNSFQFLQTAWCHPSK